MKLTAALAFFLAVLVGAVSTASPDVSCPIPLQHRPLVVKLNGNVYRCSLMLDSVNAIAYCRNNQ